MGKRFFAVGMVMALSLSLLCGCSGLLCGNDRSHVQRMGVLDSGTNVTFVLPDSECLVFDREEGSLTSNAIEAEPPAVVLEGATFPHYVLDVAEGYEALKDHLLALAVDSENPLITALAYEEGGVVYGFCNVYSSATGLLSGGGQIDARKIARGVLFTYRKERDSFIVEESIEKCVVVAYDGAHCIYLNRETYYSESMDSHIAVEICDDEAYSTGLNSRNHAKFYFGGGYCILFFHRETSWGYYEAHILVTMEGEKLAELRFISDMIYGD